MDALLARWNAAERIYSAHLRACFGNKAGDVRYTDEGQGKPGTALNAAYTEWARLRDEWYTLCDMPVGMRVKP